MNESYHDNVVFAPTKIMLAGVVAWKRLIQTSLPATSLCSPTLWSHKLSLHKLTCPPSFACIGKPTV